MDKLLKGKLPAWAKGSPHDAKSAAKLVEAIQNYVETRGGRITIQEDAAKVEGALSTRTFKLNEFVYLCPADTPETWEKMIAVTLREVVPEDGLVKEAEAGVRAVFARNEAALAPLLRDRETALSHMRLAVRLEGVRASTPQLIRSHTRALFDRFFGVVVYDFMPEADGLPKMHADHHAFREEEVLKRAEENLWATDLEASGDLVQSLDGPFAGSRIVSPDKVGTDHGHGILMTAPHQDLLLFHEVRDGEAVRAIEQMVDRMYREHDLGTAGGTGRCLFWHKRGVFREIPTYAKTIVKEDSSPYEFRLPDTFKRELNL